MNESFKNQGVSFTSIRELKILFHLIEKKMEETNKLRKRSWKRQKRSTTKQEIEVVMAEK